MNNMNPLFLIGLFIIICCVFHIMGLTCIHFLWACTILYFLYCLYMYHVNNKDTKEGFEMDAMNNVDNVDVDNVDIDNIDIDNVDVDDVDNVDVDIDIDNVVQDTTKERKKEKRKKHTKQQQQQQDNEIIDKTIQSEFHPVTKKNPFGNVLLTDIGDNPNRKAAAPCFNPSVKKDITKKVKKQTQMLNSGIVNTSRQLYGDLKDNYDLDISMQRFYSTANSRVDNDQGAFASWLYGSMHSAKESTPEGDIMRVKDNERYILI